MSFRRMIKCQLIKRFSFISQPHGYQLYAWTFFHKVTFQNATFRVAEWVSLTYIHFVV